MSLPNAQATDFFDRQDQARRKTVHLVLLFVGVVAFLSVGSYVAIGIIVDAGSLMFADRLEVFHFLAIDNPVFSIHWPVAITSVALTLAVIATGSMWKTNTLKKGGSVIADELGGSEVDASAPDALTRRYVNIVEEMALASGVPVPRIYVLNGEPGINAFAAGYSANDAAVAVTRGALRQLTRDELQGVIAHEFSHILNGDMRLNIRIIGLIHGILSIYLAGRTILKESIPRNLTRPGRREEGASVFLMPPGIILTAAGFGGVLCSRLLKGAISRQREYLADAAAIQFTRNPEGLAGALKKIGGFTYGSGLKAAHAEEVSHMCFGQISSRSTMTHPSLEERVQAIAPSFDPDLGFKKLDAETNRSGLDCDGPSPSVDTTEGADGSVSDGSAFDDSSSSGMVFDHDVDADDVLDHIGNASPEQLVYCATLLDELPPPLVEARSTPVGAVAIVYLLLLDSDKKERTKQARIIQQQAGSSVQQQTQRLWKLIRRLDNRFRLPLMDLVVPTLRRLTEEQFEEFQVITDQLIHADGQVSFREFILQRLVLHHLNIAFGKADRKSVQFRSFSGVSRDIENVLSAVTYAAERDTHSTSEAFRAGRDHLPKTIRDRISLRPSDRWDFQMIGASLERLSMAAPRIKKSVIDACAHIALFDDVVSTDEVAILRAIGENLDVPMPPFVHRASARKSCS